MGSLHGWAMALAEGDNEISLDAALSWHLQSNHYPPVPVAMNAIAKQAIELARAGEWDTPIVLPEGTAYRDGSTSVMPSTVLESFHLWDYVNTGEEEE